MLEIKTDETSSKVNQLQELRQGDMFYHCDAGMEDVFLYTDQIHQGAIGIVQIVSGEFTYCDSTTEVIELDGKLLVSES